MPSHNPWPLAPRRQTFFAGPHSQALAGRAVHATARHLLGSWLETDPPPSRSSASSSEVASEIVGEGYSAGTPVNVIEWVYIDRADALLAVDVYSIAVNLGLHSPSAPPGPLSPSAWSQLVTAVTAAANANLMETKVLNTIYV